MKEKPDIIKEINIESAFDGFIMYKNFGKQVYFSFTDLVNSIARELDLIQVSEVLKITSNKDSK